MNSSTSQLTVADWAALVGLIAVIGMSLIMGWMIVRQRMSSNQVAERRPVAVESGSMPSREVRP